MTETSDKPTWSLRIPIAIIALAAIVMGAPSVGGGYLSGDDIQLVRDHYLVNRPSLTHAVELFAIVHRDLYQPVAMLSLSLDFVVIRALGLKPTDASMNSIAWVAHAHNIGLHAINAVLVFVLLVRITDRRALAIVAALVFATHPLNVESVAWINGRMMLLSTMFLLLTMLAMEKWKASSKSYWIALVIGFAALCMMSKVRICLPVLLLIPSLYKRTKPTKRWWTALSVVISVTAVFAWINWNASRSMITSGAQTLEGSAAARSILALGWYVKRFFVPIGLSPFHPADQTINWSHPNIAFSLVVLAIAIIAIIESLRRSRTGILGTVWVISALAVTLPWIPARNQLVAERYMYLPMVGACWMVGAFIAFAVKRIDARSKSTVTYCVVGPACVVLVGLSWQAIPYYRNDIARSSRIFALYPGHPDSATAHGWSLFLGGKYEEAIDTANKALNLPGSPRTCEAKQIVGMSQLALGRLDDSIEALQQAVTADPDDGKAHHRLGIALERADRFDDALSEHQRCAELLPNFNPGLLRLARLYQRLNRSDDAKRVYEQIADNNPFDPVPVASIAEIEMAAGKYESALTKLEGLLAQYETYLPARINAGVCANALGRHDAAEEHFRHALVIDPDSELATRGLIDTLIAQSNRTEAANVIDSFLNRHPTNRTLLDVSVRNSLAMNNSVIAARHLVRAMKIEPSAADLIGKYAWLSALAGQWKLAEQSALKALSIDEKETYARIVACGVAIRNADPELVEPIADDLSSNTSLGISIVYDDFNAILQACAESQPGNPWPYYVLCLNSVRAEKFEMAQLAATEFTKRSNDPEWIAKIESLLNQVSRN